MANFFVAMGRLTADPKIRYAQSNNMAIADFNLAVERKYKTGDGPKADFFNCTAFGKTAESIEKYLKKGTKVLIEGTIQNDNYEKDGVKHYQMKVVLDSWEFAEGKKAAEETQAAGGDEFMPIPTNIDEELPFN